MTYEELHEQMQAYMQMNGIIRGYSSQQKDMAKRPCHDAIKKSDYSDILSIKDSSSAGIFYDIYAKVDEDYSVFIGCFENRGIIGRQSIKVSFFDLDKYGNLDVLLAFKRIASKQITKKLDDYEIEKQTRLAEIKELEDKMEHLRPILARISPVECPEIVKIPTSVKTLHKLTIGKTYKISDIDIICVGFTKKGYAKMQTFGMTSGHWPGEGNISKYNDVTQKFTNEWAGIIQKFRLPTLETAEANKNIKTALAKAAKNYSSFGAAYGNSWLGTIVGSNYAWYVYPDGYIDNGNYQNYSYVVAPIFNLDTSKVILDGDEIKKGGADV